MSLSKETTDTSLFDAVTSEGLKGAAKNKKDTLSTTANRTISKKPSSSASGAAATSTGHPPKASLAYKMQLHGGIKQAVKELENIDNAELESDDDDADMETEDAHTSDHNDISRGSGTLGKKEDLDKTKPRPDYIELMYGKPQTKNKRKTFMPKPALIK